MEKQLKELETLFSNLVKITTEFGLNNYGTPIHTKLEESISACRDLFAELDPKIREAQKKFYRRNFLIAGNDFHELINGHMLYKVSHDRYNVYVPTVKEHYQVLKIKDSEGEEAWVIFNQKNMTYLIKPYQDGVFLNLLESGKDLNVKESDYTFYDFSSVINNLNKLIYELV